MRKKAAYPYEVEHTLHGFDWGPVSVKRFQEDPKFGVVLRIKTGRDQIFIRVTPSGLIRTGKFSV